MSQRKIPMIHCGGRVHMPHMAGCGMGSVLLNIGGPPGGVGSSYSSIEEYQKTTGNPLPAGASMGQGLSEKLSKLMVKPLARKPTPIRF
jgi:hypothetical protein